MLEYQKKELMLGINNFNKPAEKSGINAWATLISRLLFLQKGSYPSDPEMGIELQQYDYALLDDYLTDEIQSLITDQVRTYLPDIPFEACSVEIKTLNNGTDVLLVTLAFTMPNNETEIAVVASTNSNSRFNFEITI